MVQYAFTRTAEQHALDHAFPVRADDDDIGGDFRRLFEQRGNGCALDEQGDAVEAVVTQVLCGESAS